MNVLKLKILQPEAPPNEGRGVFFATKSREIGMFSFSFPWRACSTYPSFMGVNACLSLAVLLLLLLLLLLCCVCAYEREREIVGIPIHETPLMTEKEVGWEIRIGEEAMRGAKQGGLY